MPQSIDAESFISRELHSLLFFEEFTFGRNRFSHPKSSEVELADAVVMLGDVLLIYQIKERSSNNIKNERSERQWFEKKVLGKAVKQIRDTLAHLNTNTEINVPNERGKFFNLAAQNFSQIIKLIIYRPSSNLPKDCRAVRHYDSKSAGFIHVIEAEDYLQIAKTLRVPIDVVRYLEYRESVLQKFPEDHSEMPEAVIAGHFIGGNPDDLPTFDSLEYLWNLVQDEDKWDLSPILRRIHAGETQNGFDDDYYKILIEFAKLPRSAWRAVKERFVQCIEKSKQEKQVKPYRLVYPDTGCGFVFIPISTKVSNDPRWQQQKLVSLRNFVEAHKYDRHLSKCIGVQVSINGEYFDVLWCSIESEWIEDLEYQQKLEQNFPFRAVQEKQIFSYNLGGMPKKPTDGSGGI